MIRRMAEVYIEREAGRYVDRFRSYRVILDGKKVGGVKRGESLALSTTPGRHELHFAIDWCRSPREVFELDEEGAVHARCWPKANPLTVLFFTTFGRAHYIDVEVRASEQPASALINNEQARRAPSKRGRTST